MCYYFLKRKERQKKKKDKKKGVGALHYQKMHKTTDHHDSPQLTDIYGSSVVTRVVSLASMIRA